ncbi:MAG: NTP transferase domain-containing protein [Bacteroidota bacterium]
MEQTKEIYGLVLSGGRSTRMGKDKSTIAYHGIPQREYLYELLEQVCDKTFYSIRSEQKTELSKDAHSILDKNVFKGPYNGLLSAHDEYPNVAWLVLACDLPLMDLPSLKQLILHRNRDKMATAFATRESQLPEPLCAIWESKGLETSKEYLINGTSTCPRKFLIHSETELVFPRHEQVLLNANSQEEYQEAILKLSTI